MPVTDPIADMLTRVRNANRANKDHVDVPASRVKLAITKILKDEGYIKGFKNMKGPGPQGTLRLFLKYGPEGERVISGLERVSRPGIRRYSGSQDIPRILNGLGIAIVSTSSGIMTDRQARRKNVGGEVLCAVW
ncbi:MAG: 30S ribosomal protein S8 [Candidatus Sumerlaeia bacterium]|nr:30S ribosomal protein S8 [Candidatus Sumerlaeia bacterium]